MATRRIPILNKGTIPNAAALGNVRVTTYDEYATNKIWRRLIVVFEDTATRIGLCGGFAVPQEYVGGPAIVIVWTSTSNAGNIVWDFDYRAVGGDNTESLDQTGVQQSVTVTDAAPSFAHNKMEVEIPLTATNFAGGDEVQFELFRDGAAADTIAAAGLLFNLHFQYSDSA